MAYKKYILPKSIFVETRTIADRERPTIANYGLDLYKFIQSVVDDVIPGTILSANNGLHVTGNFIQLGGDLIQNTIIDGDSTYDLTIQDVELMTLSVTDLDLSGVTVYISDASLAGASNGDV